MNSILLSKSALIMTAAFMGGTLVGISSESAAEQWNGAENAKGTIWRPGNVKIGGQPDGQDSGAALLEIQQAMTSERDLLLSAKTSYKGETSSFFEVDAKRGLGGRCNDESLAHA